MLARQPPAVGDRDALKDCEADWTDGQEFMKPKCSGRPWLSPRLVRSVRDCATFVGLRQRILQPRTSLIQARQDVLIHANQLQRMPRAGLLDHRLPRLLRLLRDPLTGLQLRRDSSMPNRSARDPRLP